MECWKNKRDAISSNAFIGDRMNYVSIKNCDIANGIGVRISLFVSGCTHHCKGCFNKEAWDFHYGKAFTEKEEEEILELLQPSYINGLSLLGGEPLEPINQERLLPFLKKVKKEYPNKTIWCYTGYLFDQDIVENMMKTNQVTKELMEYIDILVDGKFILEQKEANLRFRGSTNQRIIDVQKSLKQNKVIIWEGMKIEC